ncbi:MAG TPA: hydrogenase maturation protease [Thermoanaerobaculia bacterium]|nr:hydrogenase maturation protease [Thermoanaerobaculia bacterium]
MNAERFDLAQKVADAVLYEGYVLYPYRASAAKNRVRWQFGVVAPRAYSESGASEPWAQQTEVLVEPAGAAENVEIDLRLCCLQVQARLIEKAIDGGFEPVETLDVGDRTLVTWEEGIERRLDAAAIRLADLLAGEQRIPFDVPGGEEIEPVQDVGRIVRRRWPLSAALLCSAEWVGDRLIRVRVRTENLAGDGGIDRDKALRRSLVGAHTLLAVRGGAFVSLLDPPPEAAAAAAMCSNQHTWPVLIGEAPVRDVILSSPIILYDYPAVAPESAGDFCDATEIDEILTLRVMTLTEDEKREARGTDERARQIIERSDTIPDELFERLHGAMRSLRPVPAPPEKPDLEKELADWESFLNPAGMVQPEAASLEVGGVRVALGSRVVLRPSRRADSMDFFLAGRAARVQGIYRDVDEATYVAVSLEDDPASDMQTWHGRFLYFYPDEIEPLVSWDIEGSAYEKDGDGRIGSGSSGDSGAGAPGLSPLSEDQPDVGPPDIAADRPHTLIAGVGNIFLGDDGFGVEVAQRLAGRALPDGVQVADFGIRGVHLAYELVDKGYESTILVDATLRGGEPGTVYLIEPDLDADESSGGGADMADAHEMDPRAVFGLVRTLGGSPGRILVVGCEPACIEDAMGLSEPVAAAVEEAITLILDLVGSASNRTETSTCNGGPEGGFGK